MDAAATTTTQRLHIRVQGVVQGVGFRPFAYGLALRLGLRGFVLNDSAGATIEVEGDPALLADFTRALVEEAPPLARITGITSQRVPLGNELGFSIAPSHAGPTRNTLIAPDAATCHACLVDLSDPADRRFRYPFTNCTNCGPRFTIVQDVPYDRPNTTMGIFAMCPACQAEYDDPLDRRFHAQPNACPVCGPQARLLPGSFLEEGKDVVALAARLLAGGDILSVKGVGGYHLVCDARNAEAVERLRQRKHREARPFALMVPDLETARQLCLVSEEEAALLLSWRRPIVLLQKALSSPAAPGVAPGVSLLGLMLPYAPLHHLLLQDFARETGREHGAALVMTSGNRSDEPIAYRDDDALPRLGPIADGTLLHNRPINIRCDDSVARVVGGEEQLFRRSRGYAPQPVALPTECAVPLLACGGHLKNTFALCRGTQAFISHHIGDLQNLETLQAYRSGIEHYSRLFDVYPEAVAYDLHPDYLATKYALDLDVRHKVGVQHHHAHIASVIAEYGLRGPVIGVAADGTGYGTDGAVWGCEIMVADLLRFTRHAHLTYVPMPGGEQAVRQPWRMAAAYLSQAYGEGFTEMDFPFVHRLDHARWRPLAQMSARAINSPQTSSLGRLFDAVSALLGMRMEAQYEGQAAIELEALAEASQEDNNLYPSDILGGEPRTLDAAPIIRAIVEDIHDAVPASVIADRFHRSVAELLAKACKQVSMETGIGVVALSGGVFQNRMLLQQLTARLQAGEFTVYRNRQVPPNDGGLSFGQAAVAAARLGTMHTDEQEALVNDQVGRTKATTNNPAGSAAGRRVKKL